MNIHFALLSSNLPLRSLDTWAKATHPNTLRWDTLQYIPDNAMFWYFVHYTLCRTFVDHINSTCNRFCPILIRQVSTFQHVSYHVHNCPILSLYYTILLQSVPSCKFSSNPMLFAVIMESNEWHHRVLFSFPGHSNLKSYHYLDDSI